MKKQLIDRFHPLHLRTKTLTNRVVVPPMASETADELGYVTEKTIEHYRSLARSKAGLVIVEYSFVHISGRSEEFQLGIDQDDQVRGLRRVALAIKSQGAVAGIQLTHAGGKSETIFTGGSLPSPSGIVVPVKEKELETPHTMDLSEINLWKDSFLHAADRASEAGFSLIELHAAHGYGLNQWLSPLTNKRTDKYQGAQLLYEIVTQIKNALPHLLISVRLPGQDFIPGGLTPEDSLLIAKNLETLGVDVVNISSGIGGWRRPGDRSGEGYLVNEASFIASHISIPVIGVGGIESAGYIDHMLNQNKVALAAVGRAILKDSKQWGETHLKETIHA